MQHLKSRPLFRALGLLWSRIGPARIYVLAGAIALLVLASVGLVQLLSSGSGDSQGSTTMGPEPTDATPVKEALIAITEIGSSETRGRNGQKNVAVKIGVAPRPNLRKGEVEIRVAFFDLTETNEMRPTEAEVNYEWLTPVRDWTDPTPKYLVATYEGARSSRKSARESPLRRVRGAGLFRWPITSRTVRAQGTSWRRCGAKRHRIAAAAVAATGLRATQVQPNPAATTDLQQLSLSTGAREP